MPKLSYVDEFVIVRQIHWGSKYSIIALLFHCGPLYMNQWSREAMYRHETNFS